GRGGEAPGHPALHGCSRHHPGPPCGARRRRAGRRAARGGAGPARRRNRERGAFRRIARRAGAGAFLPSPAPCQGARSRGGRTEAIRWGPIVGPGTPFVRRIHRFFATVALAACVAGTTAAADRITGKPFATRSEVHAPHAMAATSHPLATQV